MKELNMGDFQLVQKLYRPATVKGACLTVGNNLMVASIPTDLADEKGEYHVEVYYSKPKKQIYLVKSDGKDAYTFSQFRRRGGYRISLPAHLKVLRIDRGIYRPHHQINHLYVFDAKLTKEK